MMKGRGCLPLPHRSGGMRRLWSAMPVSANIPRRPIGLCGLRGGNVSCLYDHLSLCALIYHPPCCVHLRVSVATVGTPMRCPRSEWRQAVLGGTCRGHGVYMGFWVGAIIPTHTNLCFELRRHLSPLSCLCRHDTAINAEQRRHLYVAVTSPRMLPLHHPSQPTRSPPPECVISQVPSRFPFP